MRKVLVFQHVAHKILGTLNPTLKDHGLNMRYINFDRTPEECPDLQKYNGLIVLGGHMGVYEAEKYKHIATELKLIEDALKKDIPVLGICLGAQLLANVLGSEVRKSPTKEIGWCDITLTPEGIKDPLFSHFEKQEKIFQLHGDTFDIPKSATQLVTSAVCPAQAFRYNKAYGIQFHLEVDQAMIWRWLESEQNRKNFFNSCPDFNEEKIRAQTYQYLDRSSDLSVQTFNKFIELFNLKERPRRLGSL